MLDPLFPMQLCALGHVLNMCNVPASSAALQALRKHNVAYMCYITNGINSTAAISQETISRCYDLDFFCVISRLRRNLKIKANFSQVHLGEELLHPVSICSSEFAAEADHCIQYMFTLEMQKHRAGELWNCLDSTCERLYVCLPVSQRTEIPASSLCQREQILSTALRCTLERKYFKSHIESRSFLSMFHSLWQVNMNSCLNVLLLLWNSLDSLVCCPFYSTDFTQTALSTSAQIWYESFYPHTTVTIKQGRPHRTTVSVRYEWRTEMIQFLTSRIQPSSLSVLTKRQGLKNWPPRRFNRKTQKQAGTHNMYPPRMGCWA